MSVVRMDYSLSGMDAAEKGGFVSYDDYAKLEAEVEMYKNTLRDILGIDDEVYDVYDCISWAKKALEVKGE